MLMSVSLCVVAFVFRDSTMMGHRVHISFPLGRIFSHWSIVSRSDDFPEDWEPIATIVGMGRRGSVIGFLLRCGWIVVIVREVWIEQELRNECVSEETVCAANEVVSVWFGGC